MRFNAPDPASTKPIERLSGDEALVH